MGENKLLKKQVACENLLCLLLVIDVSEHTTNRQFDTVCEASPVGGHDL